MSTNKSDNIQCVSPLEIKPFSSANRWGAEPSFNLHDIANSFAEDTVEMREHREMVEYRELNNAHDVARKKIISNIISYAKIHNISDIDSYVTKLDSCKSIEQVEVEAYGIRRMIYAGRKSRSILIHAKKAINILGFVITFMSAYLNPAYKSHIEQILNSYAEHEKELEGILLEHYFHNFTDEDDKTPHIAIALFNLATNVLYSSTVSGILMPTKPVDEENKKLAI